LRTKELGKHLTLNEHDDDDDDDDDDECICLCLFDTVIVVHGLRY